MTGRRHGRGEGDAGVLAVVAVADHALGDEDLLAVSDGGGRVFEGIFVLLAADGDVVFDPVGDGGLGFAGRRGGLAAGERQGREEQDE